MCRTVWSLQTDVDYVHSVVADLEKEWVHLLIETLWRSENAPSPSDVCMCHQWPPFVQVFYRTEFRLAGGDLPTSRLLPWPRQPQGDFRRLQRESQVSNVHTVRVWRLCCLWVQCPDIWLGQNAIEIIMGILEKPALRELKCMRATQMSIRMSQEKSGREQASESF